MKLGAGETDRAVFSTFKAGTVVLMQDAKKSKSKILGEARIKPKYTPCYSSQQQRKALQGRLGVGIRWELCIE